MANEAFVFGTRERKLAQFREQIRRNTQNYQPSAGSTSIFTDLYSPAAYLTIIGLGGQSQLTGLGAVQTRGSSTDAQWMQKWGSRPRTLFFQYLGEAGFTDNTQALWAELPAIGRPEPYQVYQGTSARKITFTLEFYANDNQEVEVNRRIAWLQALCYPFQGGHKTALPPPVLALSFGKQFQGVRCVLNSANVVWEGPHDVDTLRFYHARVEVEVTVTNLTPPVAGDIYDNRAAIRGRGRT